MDIIAFTLVVFSACMHAYWNYLLKKSEDTKVFIWLFLLGSMLIFFPVFISLAPIDVPVSGWCCILTAGLAHALYLISLSSAYEKGDLSLVYPLARSAPIIFVLIGAIVFLGEMPSGIGMAGMTLIILGCYALHSDSLRALFQPLTLKSLNSKPSQLALLTAGFIALYSLIDRVGIEYVQIFRYIYLVFVFMFVFYTPFILIKRDKKEIKAEWASNRRNILIVAFLCFFTFFLILIAMSLAKLSYIVALRQLSIIFSVMLGAWVLKEEHGDIRFTASLLIFAGSFLIAIAK
jgi:drug/metabolite transporter (DMT)-like permease